MLPRTGRGFLESARPWSSGWRSCFYSPHAVASLHPSAWPSSAARELHDHFNQDNFLPSQPCLPPSWLRGEEEEAIGTETGKKTKKQKRKEKPIPSPLGPRRYHFLEVQGLGRSPEQKTPEVTAEVEASLRGWISALPCPSGDFLARNIDIVIDEGRGFRACTRLVVLPVLLGWVLVKDWQESQPFHQKQG